MPSCWTVASWAIGEESPKKAGRPSKAPGIGLRTRRNRDPSRLPSSDSGISSECRPHPCNSVWDTPGRSSRREKGSLSCPSSEGVGLFEGFELRKIKTEEAEIRIRVGGSGPPLLLLHGHPQTH